MRSLHSLLDPATMPFGRRRFSSHKTTNANNADENNNVTSPSGKKNKLKLTGWSRSSRIAITTTSSSKQSVTPLVGQNEGESEATVVQLQQLYKQKQEEQKQQQMLRQKNRLLHEVVTTTSCHERLHLVLSPRRTSSEWRQVLDELRLRHSGLVKTVCVYTDDSPLSSAACSSASTSSSSTTSPTSYNSNNNNAAFLLSMTRICHYMTTLQLDFSSEFQLPLLPTAHSITNPNSPASWTNQVNVLECNGLADILHQAPQLHTLSLRDVRLMGCPAKLKRALLTHPNLHTLEVKWCSTIETSQLMRMRRNININRNEEADIYPSYSSSEEDDHEYEYEHDNDESPPRETILASIIHAMCDMPHLQEVTLLLSSAHELPLSQLARATNGLQKLTLGLEQRHVTTTAQAQAFQIQIQNQQQPTIPAAAVAAAQRYHDQQGLLDFLQALASSQASHLHDLTIISHHWKPKATLPIITQLVANATLKLQSLSITDYNGYGCDHPHEIHDLIAALETNACLTDLKIVTKKRMATAMASTAAAAAAVAANSTTTTRPTTLQQPQPITTANPKGRRQVHRALYHAMANCLAHKNFTLASIEIVHAGVSMVHTNNTSSSSSTSSSSTTMPTFSVLSMFESLYSPSSSSIPSLSLSQSQKRLMAKSSPADRQYYHHKAMVPLYLQANAVQARQIMWNAATNNNSNSAAPTTTSKSKSDAAAVLDFLMQHKDNTPLLYFMLQGNPQAILSLVLLPTISSTTITANSNAANGHEQETNTNDESSSSFPNSDWECYY